MTEVKLIREFKARPEAVWNAITDPEKMKEWYFHVRDFKLEEGCVFTFYEKEEGGSFLHRCEILKIEPGRLLEHTWEHPSHSQGKSVLKWELEPVEEETVQLTLTHSGLENLADAGPEFAPENYEFGWKGIVGISLRNYLSGIKKLVYKVDIHAPKETVWEKLWGQESYRDWTSVFDSGSHYKGELRQGERVHLLSGSGEGMYSDVVYVKENEQLIFSHIGSLENGQELPVDEDTARWSGSLENYILTAIPGGTRVRAEVDCTPEYIEHMNEKFPQALQRLKEISENK